MAEYEVSDPEDILPCPYNKAHAVLAKRMQMHLIKCRRQHEISNQFTPCPFNAKHEVPKAELRYHLTVCPDRVRLNEKILLSDNTELKGCTDVPAYKPLNIRGENWDDDIPKYTTPKASTDYLPNSQFLRVSSMNNASLTAKQKRDLYLQSKQASEEPKLRAPRQTSQAVAIHLQQQKQKQEQKDKPPANIYEFALQKCAAGGLGRGKSIVSRPGDGPCKANVSMSSIASSPANGTISNSSAKDAMQGQGVWGSSATSMGRGMSGVTGIIPTAGTGRSFLWNQELQRQALLRLPVGLAPLGAGRGNGFVASSVPVTGQSTVSLGNQPDKQVAPPALTPVSSFGPLDSNLDDQLEDDFGEHDDLASTPDWVGDGYGGQNIGSWADAAYKDFSE